jgi:hypothetical protein
MGTIKTFDKFFDQTGLVLEKINGNEPERRLVNDITVYFRNASNPEQTRSHETTFVWLDEFGQMREDVLTLCNASQRQWGNNFNYQTYITSTPRGRNHFYRRFKKQIESPHNDDEQVGFYHTTTMQAIKDGVDLPEGYVENMGYVEGSEMWQQEIEGDFVSWAGLVFHQFNASRHCPDPFVLPTFSRVYGGIDVGYGGITAMNLTGLTPQGGMYTFKEYYQKRAQTHEWMPLAAEWTRRYNVHRWYIDAAADIEYRGMKSAGLPVHQSMKAKDAAGSAVGFINSKFARDEMFIDRNECPFLVSEIETYQYKELLSGDEVTFLEKTKPNQPDHGIDGWRYHILPLSAALAAQSYGKSVEFAIG